MNRFDGKNFAESIIIVLLIVLLVFGSKDIIGLSNGPTIVDN